MKVSYGRLYSPLIVCLLFNSSTKMISEIRVHYLVDWFHCFYLLRQSRSLKISAFFAKKTRHVNCLADHMLVYRAFLISLYRCTSTVESDLTVWLRIVFFSKSEFYHIWHTKWKVLFLFSQFLHWIWCVFQGSPFGRSALGCTWLDLSRTHCKMEQL